jgi:hypothetical protein
VSRFSSGAAQGERIKSSGHLTGALCLLVADEADFMFDDFKQALEEAARAQLGSVTCP